MGPNIHRHPSQTPFTHHPYPDTCPYPISPMAPNTYTHPYPKPFHPWAQTLRHPYTDPLHPSSIHRHLPHPISPMASILTCTHPLNPFTHEPKHCQTPIPICPSPMAHTQTPISLPIHPWYPILTHTHTLNPFTHGPKHCQTPIPTCPSPMAHTQTPMAPKTYTHPSPKPFHPWV